MNTASLENSKKLVNISSWGDDTEFVYYVNGGQYSGEVYHRTQVFDKPGNIPAYDSGYLLRKLPEGSSVHKVLNGYTAWPPQKYAKRGISEVYDTPEDALCLLVIKLIEDKVLEL